MLLDQTTPSGPFAASDYTDLTVTYANESTNRSSFDYSCTIPYSKGNPMVSQIIPFTTFSFCVLGNLFAIIFLWRNNQRSDKKQHIFYTLIMTLACCDFVSVIVTSPVTFVAYLSKKCLLELGGTALCQYSGFAMTFFGLGSVAIVFAMSLERFLAIRFTLYYQRTMTTHKTRIFLLILLVSFLALSALPFLGFGEVAQQFPGSWCYLNWKSTNAKHQGFNFLVAFLGIILMIGTIVCNLVVVIRVSQTRRRMRHRNSSHGLLSRGKKKRISQQETQMIVLLGLMTVVFVVCYLPILLRIIINQVSTIMSPEFAKSHLSSWDLLAVRMASINPIIDPWVYILCRRSILSKAFRFLKLVFLCRCKKDEFQELCLSSRDFRRRKSIRIQRASTSTFSSINGREAPSINGIRRVSRSPRNELHEIKESPVEEDPLTETNGSHITMEVNGNHICPKDKIALNEQEESSQSISSESMTENPSE